jgi:WD40 repeat protein
MDTPAKYDAFISYRHRPLDKAVAEKLQRLLEAYRPPRGGNYAVQRISRVFRDQSELPVAGDLGADIKEALENSRFLIVICSEETKNSHFCMEEIGYFKQIHDGNNENILTLLVSGDPNEVFPDALRYEKRKIRKTDGTEEVVEVPVEPLAADVRSSSIRESLKLLRSEFLRIAAPIFGCGFDDLYRRHQRRRVQRIIQLSASILTAVVLVGAYVIYSQQQLNASRLAAQEQELIAQEQKLIAQEQEAAANEQKLIADNEKITRALIEAQDLINSGNKIQATKNILDLIDSGAELGDYAKTEVDRLLYQSTYVPKYGQYAVLEHDEAVSAVLWIDSTLFCATEGGELVAWDTKNATEMWRIKYPTPIIAMIQDGESIYAVTGDKSVLTLNIHTGDITGEFSYYNGTKELGEYVIDDIMLYGDNLYIAEMYMMGEFQIPSGYQVTLIDLVNKQGGLLFNYTESDEQLYFWSCYFDKAQNRIILSEMGQTDNYIDVDLADNSFEYVSAGGSTYINLYNSAKSEMMVFTAGDDGAWTIITSRRNGSDTRSFTVTAENSGGFTPETMTAQAVSSDGKYIALGGYGGNIIVFDTESQAIIKTAELPYQNVSDMTIIDNEFLLIGFESADSNAILLNFQSDLENYIALPNTFGQIDSTLSPLGDVMGVISMDGVVDLYSLRDAMIEEDGYADLDNLSGIDTSEFGVELTGDETHVHVVSDDGKHRLVTRVTKEKPDYGVYRDDTDDYISYWISDNISGEPIYNVYLPKDFVAIDIKDDTFATILTKSYYLYDVNMKTGETLRTVKVTAPFTEEGWRSKIEINYETGMMLLTTTYMSYLETMKYRGVAVSYANGDVLFEFSDVMRDTDLWMDKSASTIYKLSLYDVTTLVLKIPTPSELLGIARRQVAGA